MQYGANGSCAVGFRGSNPANTESQHILCYEREFYPFPKPELVHTLKVGLFQSVWLPISSG